MAHCDPEGAVQVELGGTCALTVCSSGMVAASCQRSARR